MKSLFGFLPAPWNLFLLLATLPLSIMADQVIATINGNEIHLDEIVGPRDPTASKDTRLDDIARVGELPTVESCESSSIK